MPDDAVIGQGTGAVGLGVLVPIGELALSNRQRTPGLTDLGVDVPALRRRPGQVEVLAAAARACLCREQIQRLGLIAGSVVPFGLAVDHRVSGVVPGVVVVVVAFGRLPAVVPAW